MYSDTSNKVIFINKGWMPAQNTLHVHATYIKLVDQDSQLSWLSLENKFELFFLEYLEYCSIATSHMEKAPC